MPKRNSNIISGQKLKSVVLYYNNTTYDLEVRLSQIPDSGLGVFTNQFIEAGTFIGYYEGHWHHNMRTASNYSYYINRRSVIDIDPSNKPYTSMFNDAYRTDFYNNICSKVLLDDSIIETISAKNSYKIDPNKVVGLYATKHIRPGEEMFFEYGDFYWKGW